MALPTLHSPSPARSKAALLHGALACVIMLVAGSTFALGVFTVVVEEKANPPHSLNGVWETAMGLMHFASAPIMIATGIYLDNGKNDVASVSQQPWHLFKTGRVRILCIISTFSFASLGVATYGAANSVAWALYFGVGMQAFPLAIVFLLGTEILLAWFPQQAGLAVGCGQSAFGIGTIILTEVFSVLIRTYDHVTAIFLASAILTCGAVFPTIFLRWPGEGEVNDAAKTDQEEQPLLQTSTPTDKIPMQRLLMLRDFWLYIFAVFTTSTSYMLNPYYFKLGGLFNKPMGTLVLLFNLSNLAATLCGLFGTALTDVVKFGSGYFFSGAKNLMILFMIMQTLLFLQMIAVSNSMNFWGFIVIKALLKIVVTCHVGYAAILARDLFGASNSCVVFGFGGGLALGFGEGLSAWLMAAVERSVGIVKLPSDYSPYYWLAAVWSFLGLVCTVTVTRQHGSQTIKNQDMIP